MRLKTWLLARTALSSALFVGVGMAGAMAADVVIVPPVIAPAPIPVGPLPAVSGFNFKIDAAYGTLSPPILGMSGPGYRIQAAASLPIGHAFGLQVDGAYASILGLPAWHAAAHAFWRNPARALFGVYGSYDIWGGLTRYRAAAEAELYLNRITLEGLVGYEFGTVPNTWFAAADVAFYLTDNLRIDVGYQRNGFGNALTAGAEFQFLNRGNMGVAAFFDGAFGGGGYQRILGGIRLYFGQGGTLINRHRQDDPRINVDEMGCGAVTTDGAVNPLAPCAQQPPPPPPTNND